MYSPSSYRVSISLSKFLIILSVCFHSPPVPPAPPAPPPVPPLPELPESASGMLMFLSSSKILKPACIFFILSAAFPVDPAISSAPSAAPSKSLAKPPPAPSSYVQPKILPSAFETVFANDMI